MDAETGNIYLRARYYDSEIGRFISEDPAEDGLNWYAYCRNDPVMYFDSTGEAATAIVGGTLFAIYAVTQLQKDIHFENNAKFSFDRKQFIINQREGNAAKSQFGLFKGDHNGCSWVSIFNALVFMGDSSLPANIIYELEGRTLLFGHLILIHLRFATILEIERA